MADLSTTATQTTTSNLLRNAMRANGIFSAVSGVLAILFAGSLTDLTGIQPQIVFTILGVVLLLYAIDLFWIASRPTLDLRFGWVAVMLDLAWVIGSLVLLLTDLLPLTTAGKWLIAILADIVLVFAIAQFIGIRRLEKSQ